MKKFALPLVFALGSLTLLSFRASNQQEQLSVSQSPYALDTKAVDAFRWLNDESGMNVMDLQNKPDAELAALPCGVVKAAKAVWNGTGRKAFRWAMAAWEAYDLASHLHSSFIVRDNSGDVVDQPYLDDLEQQELISRL